ncbi:MAG: 5'-methylthioadenosine/S-adenosylhomocysteine nucleosidase, partial [Chitinispirillales bacterium]|nr:5'-methylthioadenosine/S-adenosylhomocysteine nucleosidase [Chitinispirillales bacterium]
EDQDIERNHSLGYLPLLKRHRPGFVIAMNEEFTSDLKELLATFSSQIIISGIGTTNAALAAQSLILKEKCNIIINIGIVGALDKNLQQGDLCTPCNTMYHDADNSLILMGKEKLFSLDTSWNNNRKFKEVKTIVSGNTFIDKREKADLLMNDHGAAIVDMESAALAHTCSMLDTPLVIMKVVSDYCDAPVFQLNTGYMDGIAPHLADYLKTLNI